MTETTDLFSKHAKYTTGNPISRYLVDNFFKHICQLVSTLKFESILDVGCGEGFLLGNIRPYLTNVRCFAVDADPKEVADAARNLPFCQVKVGDVYQLPFADNEIELVICTEVLEHLTDPAKALRELARITRRYVILSVPREPIWRMLNLTRGSYWSDWGNTPGHLNHWNSAQFIQFTSQQFTIIRQQTPLPWTIMLGEKKLL